MSNLVVLSGISQTVAQSRWEAAETLRVGRLQSLDVVLNDPSVSRQHAEIACTPQGWMVRDLGSAQGTMLNGVLVAKEPRRLQVEDVLQFGKIVVKVAQLETHSTPAVPLPRTNGNLKTTGSFVRIQALSQRTWEQGAQELERQDLQLPQGQHFLTLLRNGYYLGRLLSLPDLLQSFLEDVVTVLNAQRGAVALFDDKTRELSLRAHKLAPHKSSAKRFYSSTLAHRCFFKGESLLCQDVNTQMDLKTSKSVMAGDMASILCVVLRSPRRRLGILHLDRGPVQEPFSEEEFRLAEAIATGIAVAIDSAMDIETQRQAIYLQGQALARLALTLHQPARLQQAQEVYRIAAQLGEALRLPPEDLHHVLTAALLLDIASGKNDAFHNLEPIMKVLRHHQENWDGSGGPDGLAGTQIPLAARVLAVAKAYVLIAGAQPNRSPAAHAEALAHLQAKAGTQFDPACIEHLPPILSGTYPS